MAKAFTADLSESIPPQQPRLPILNPSEKFFRYFQNEVTDLQADIDRLPTHSTTGGERSDAVDHALASIARLGIEVNNASSYLPAYDQRTYNDAVKALGAKLADAREKLAPRQKFSFKKRTTGRENGLGSVLGPGKKNESAISLGDAATLAEEKRKQVPGYEGGTGSSSLVSTPADTPSPANEESEREIIEAIRPTTDDMASTSIGKQASSHATPIDISGHNGLRIITPLAASHANSSGTISNLNLCVVDLSRSDQSLAGLTLKNIYGSLIICGQVEGAAYLTGLRGSVIVVQSRQVRIHDSTACDIYLATASRPIIEDCSQISFGPLPAAFGGNNDESGQWREVDDFKWLRKEPSPNFHVRQRGEGLKEDIWQGLKADKFGVEVAEILSWVGVPALPDA